MTASRFTAAELAAAAEVANKHRARTVPIYTAQVRQIERAKQAQEKRQK
jgi:hypothetical protein